MPARRPTLAIIGRPNVGKSTLFNRITRSRAALVADVPGLTRDPKVGIGRLGEAGYIVVDTGGIDETSDDVLAGRVAEHALAVARDCDAAIFVVDGRAGLNAADELLAAELRRAGVALALAVNKAEGLDGALVTAEFRRLGIAAVFAISAAHGDGVAALVEHLTGSWPPASSYLAEDDGRTRIAVVGRPNVGKSTLVNRVLGEERMITYDLPGTTRDSVDADFERHGRAYTIIDTAGLRRKSRTEGVAEKFSAVQTLQALDRAQVVLLVLDARDGITEQDVTLLGMVVESGRALVVVVNKWDGLDADQRQRIKSELDRRLRFATFAEIHFISALHGSGVGELFGAVDAAAAAALRTHKTGDLTRLLEAALAAHQPPLVRGRRIKLRYAHMGGLNPPTIVIHGNQVDALPGSYQRYLENYFREALGLVGTPIRLELRQSDNPYAGRRNKLTPRQQAKRRRLMQHVKRKK
ncbi:MAG: ribosome biogenesis GTPase Der [Gammaproteobacteria bacterium]|nr:ribosome biogenesis GTPase Der [Gammaproteobacteria bacterium]